VGQKTHPIGFRLGVIRTWSSKWYEEKRYAEWLHEDIKIRAFIGQAESCRDLEDRDRAHGEQGEGERVHRSPGHRHR